MEGRLPAGKLRASQEQMQRTEGMPGGSGSACRSGGTCRSERDCAAERTRTGQNAPRAGWLRKWGDSTIARSGFEPPAGNRRGRSQGAKSQRGAQVEDQ